MRRVLTLVFIVALCASLSACGSSSLSANSPKAARASIVAAALAQKSVHWTMIDRPHMSTPARLTADVNTNSGKQRITFAPATRYEGKVRLRLVNHTVYVQGDAVGLWEAHYLTRVQARDYAGQWIAIPKGDSLYTQAADGLTLASIIHDATPRGKLTVTTRKAGTGRLVVKGNGFPWTSLSAPASGNPLPVAFTIGDCLGCWAAGHFSKWNEPVNVQAPARATPIAIVRGSPSAVHAAIVATALAQKSVRLTATVDRRSFGKRTYTIDVSRDSVSERIKSEGSTMRLLVYDHAVYLRADAPLLRDRLGLNQGQARRYAGKWIWIPQAGADRGLYAELTDGLTLATIVRRTTRMKDVTLASGMRGANVLVVRGAPASRSLPVTEVKARAKGTPLPIAFSGRGTAASASGRFSRWNEPVDIRLPESSTPIAIVRGD